jgi:hypothetical protein
MEKGLRQGPGNSVSLCRSAFASAESENGPQMALPSSQ